MDICFILPIVKRLFQSTTEFPFNEAWYPSKSPVVDNTSLPQKLLESEKNGVILRYVSSALPKIPAELDSYPKWLILLPKNEKGRIHDKI